jgi:hypothetical protein
VPGPSRAVDIRASLAEKAGVLTGKPKDGRRRFARGQKFTLSPAGLTAAAEYRSAVNGARSSGRQALEAALVAWAEPLRVAPGDGVVLAELSGKPVGLSKMSEVLETSGLGAEDVRAAVGRLVDAGIVELVPLASQLQP